jgi:TRAP-type C4-dicarboxylate transport system permease small subunit
MGGAIAAVLVSARALGAVNAAVLAVGRAVGVACMALMVVLILVQVFWRYVLDDPLPWPEEAARFLMLWLMVVAPTALRRGGFVAIDMVRTILPRIVGGLLTLALLCLSLTVLWVAIRIGWAEVTGFSGRFATSALYYPTGEGWEKVPRAWMMASLLVGAAMLASVTVELILRQAAVLLGQAAALPAIPGTDAVGAE